MHCDLHAVGCMVSSACTPRTDGCCRKKKLMSIQIDMWLQRLQAKDPDVAFSLMFCFRY